jgi:molybdopterin-synthase adenylyltransferase
MIMSRELTAEEWDRYRWQTWVEGFGEAGQRALKNASVLVSRIGGVGGTVALELAAAGVGRLILAHGGNLRRNDLNRQLLMNTDGIGTPRVELAKVRLQALNPHVDIVVVGENITSTNVRSLVEQCDLVVSAAPLFEERLLMNQEAVRQSKPLIDCAMYELEGRLTTILPGRTPCLSCLYPESPPHWKREFPVFAAVASTVASLATMEAIKVLSGLGTPLAGRLLTFDLGTMNFRQLEFPRLSDCPVCGSVPPFPQRVP